MGSRSRVRKPSCGEPQEVESTYGGNVTAGRVPETPGSTYRLQLTPDFGFEQAAETIDYLADLGVTHAYLSPVLEAAPGSMHGYDVTDHGRIRAELAADLRVIGDVVPVSGPGDRFEHRR